MIDPVLGSVFGEGKFRQTMSGDDRVEVSQNTQTCSRDEGVSTYHRYMTVAFFCKAVRR